jgi:hypothetical protein
MMISRSRSHLSLRSTGGGGVEQAVLLEPVEERASLHPQQPRSLTLIIPRLGERFKFLVTLE